MNNNLWIKLAVTGGAAIVIIARLIFPELKIDSVSLVLIVIALLPWLTSFIESAKFPGGWEVKFRNVEAAGQKIMQQAPPQPAKSGRAIDDSSYWPDMDSNLALVSLRIEIEQRLRALAGWAGIRADRSLTHLIQRLGEKGVLLDGAVSGLRELISAGNQAAHGATVEPNIGNWARENGPLVISTLDAILADRDIHEGH